MPHVPLTSRRLVLPAAILCLLLVAACGAGGGAGWTYAPLGPTAAPSASGDPSSAPSGEPSASPGMALAVETPTDPAQGLAFVPAELEAPPATVIQVTYTNNSNLPHNINFFNGPDSTAESLGATEVVIGPNAPESVTFKTPEEPGAYYFWCDVHLDDMAGTLNVGP